MLKAKTISKSFSFPSSVEYLEKIESISCKIARKAGFDESVVDDISIALTELVNNAIHHGNKNDPSKKVCVDFNVYDDRITIGIKDEGNGFSPESISNPLDPNNLLSDNGRGIYLAKALMDKIDFNISRHGTEVLITKNK